MATSRERTHRRRPIWLGAFVIAGILAAAPPACVTDPRPDLPQDAIVTYETVRFAPPNEDDPNLPDEMAMSTGFATTSQPLVGDQSQARALALGTIRATNGLLFGTLFTIDLVTAFPPREASETQWAWQGADFNGTSESRFVLDDRSAETRRFGYDLGKRSVGTTDPFETGFDGEFSPVDDPSATARIRTGTGVLRYHFDTLKTYNPDSAAGQMSIALRSESGVRRVRAFMREVQGNNDPRPLTAVYEYTQNEDGSGDYSFSVRADWFLDGEPLEDVAVRVVWTPDGGGRVLGIVSGGSVDNFGVSEFTVQECWGAADGITTWVDTTPDNASLEGGAESDCPAALQGIAVEPPVAEVPPATGDPEIP